MTVLYESSYPLALKGRLLAKQCVSSVGNYFNERPPLLTLMIQGVDGRLQYLSASMVEITETIHYRDGHFVYAGYGP